MTLSSSGQVPLLRLRDEVEIPQLGFGVFLVPPAETEAAVAEALRVGYRHVDTAAAYGNEEGVAAAYRDSGLARDEVFITTKCFNDTQGYEHATSALHASLRRLGLEQVDLYLIHWPVPSKDLYVDTWRAFIDLHAAGLTRSIGVSNFEPEHLHRIVDETGVVPTVNQIELHPRLTQPELRALHAELGIVTEAWSPLGRGAALHEPVITEIAGSHGKTAAEVVIRWHLQIGNVVIPKSVTPERIAENFDVFDFELGDDEIAAIEGLNRDERIGPDPNVFVMP
jgi:diketogulonate reductase-like aldo/keto reductase